MNTNSPEAQRVLETLLKVYKVRFALQNRDPFCKGICAIPDYQRALYYTDGDDNRRINFSNAESNDLDALYRACKPAEFGRGGESILDSSYRKAGKMGVASFATLFDPRSLGIYDQVSKELLSEDCAAMDMELSKLNVYGKDDFFKAHKDTPRSRNMFGSLVVVFPTVHERGEFAAAKNPTACFVAFYADLEHEVLPVTSGYRVTLTYNLYKRDHTPAGASGEHANGGGMSSIRTPYHIELQQELSHIVNDRLILPRGGYLGFGLVHEYPQSQDDVLGPLPQQLKGSDRALMDTCDALGLGYSFRLYYPDIGGVSGLKFLTTKPLDLSDVDPYELGAEQEAGAYLDMLLRTSSLTIDEVEGVVHVGEQHRVLGRYGRGIRSVCKNPVRELLDVTEMKSSLEVTSPVSTYGNEPGIEMFYGTACIVVPIEPAETRHDVQVKS